MKLEAARQYRLLELQRLESSILRNVRLQYVRFEFCLCCQCHPVPLNKGENVHPRPHDNAMPRHSRNQQATISETPATTTAMFRDTVCISPENAPKQER